MMFVCRTLQGGMLQHGIDHCHMLRVKLLQVSDALEEVERPVEDELTSAGRRGRFSIIEVK